MRRCSTSSTDSSANCAAAGIAVSVRESIDAAEAIEAIGLERRATLKSALLATLVKAPDHLPIFKATFEVFFSLRGPGGTITLPDREDLAAPAGSTAEEPSRGFAPHGEAEALGPNDVRRLAAEALRSGNLVGLTTAARLAVELFGGVDPSRPVGVSYYLHRTLRGLELDALLAAIGAEGGGDEVAPSSARARRPPARRGDHGTR